MDLVLAFSVVLAAAVLVSSRAHRTVLSTTVLFLAAGILLGPQLTGVLSVDPSGGLLYWTTEIALFAVLFTDGLDSPLQSLRKGWRLPARTLGIAMPLTIGLAAALALGLLGLPWEQALLLGAVLGPTDPVLAEAIIGREAVPARVRAAISTESGLNDGLALPLVIVVLGVLGGEASSLGQALTGMVVGVAIGVGIAWGMLRLERLPIFGATPRYRPLLVLAVALMVFSLGASVHVNLFLAAFAAGITLATAGPEESSSFRPIGGPVVEVLKLLAVLLVGVLFASDVFNGTHPPLWFYAVLVLVAVRPVAVMVSLLGTTLRRRERGAIAWFGPKGFASVTYSLLVLRSGIPYAGEVFQAAAATIAVSIVAHSSTDVVVARWLGRAAEQRRRSSESAAAGDRAPPEAAAPADPSGATPPDPPRMGPSARLGQDGSPSAGEVDRPDDTRGTRPWTPRR